MDSESINWINLNLQNVNKDINNKIHDLNNFAKILLLGDSETGKTTLKNILLNKKCYVYKNEFDDVELKFIDNDDANNDDKTQLISIDYNSKLIFCECPPLESDDGLNEEILNSLIIDSIIQAHSKNNRNFMKILLIISAPEFESGRGRGILKKICRIYRMFPQTEKMKDGFGLVITKGIEECRGKDYLKRLQERSPDDLKQICDFFLINKNKVFVLPKPSKAKIGRKYEFDDHDSLQNFIMDEYIEDPITKVTLSDYSESELKGILLRQSQQRDTIINEIFSKMAELYQKETNNDYSLWKNLILQMNDIDCVNDLRTYIENNIPEIPNMPNFVYNFQTLDKYQNIHDSINILFKKGNDSNFIKDILLQNVLKATRQIDILYSNSQEIKLKDELNKALDKKKDTLCGILQKGQNILDECSITNEEPQKEPIVIDESLLTNEEPHNKQIKIDESFLTNDEQQKEQIKIDESFLTNDEQQKDNQYESRDIKFAKNVEEADDKIDCLPKCKDNEDQKERLKIQRYPINDDQKNNDDINLDFQHLNQSPRINDQKLIDEKRRLDDYAKREYQRIMDEKNQIFEQKKRQEERINEELKKIQELKNLGKQRFSNDKNRIKEKVLREEQMRKEEKLFFEEQVRKEEEKVNEDEQKFDEKMRTVEQHLFEEQCKLAEDYKKEEENLFRKEQEFRDFLRNQEQQILDAQIKLYD
ncbi:hypothetical protein M9Y10_023645 [Tritrichomonas musculus]|uniref:G domain-containing protein n=1 Tax=Tritrichomonas musculus TaxID=1915356 RepID=A0ABR2KWI3_9EUKA